MIKEKPAILVVDDEESMLITYKSMLKDDYNLTLCQCGKEALEKVNERPFNIAILDLKMPDMDGLEVLRNIKKINPDIEVIMSTAINDAKFAVQAMKEGAFEYITKPFELDELLSIIKNIFEKKLLIKENIYLRSVLNEQQSYQDLIGRTPVMQNIFMTIENISGAGSTVLITGESGTGKELVAHAIHNKSRRKDKPFVIVNCAAIPENLFESELFGHERGAFTGAIERKIGKFELADGGTVFLDEIGCMPTNMQSKLLRVIQDNKIDRVGGKNPIEIDVRIVAATNIDVEKAIKNNTFREDLYYRLNVIPINLPPLRRRKADIPLFVNYFLKKFNKELKKNIREIGPEVMRTLIEYDWPGNGRELKNVMERVVALAKTNTITKIPLNTDFEPSCGPQNLKEACLEFEKNYIQKILDSTGGNQSEAARILGIHRTTLISKMKR